MAWCIVVEMDLPRFSGKFVQYPREKCASFNSRIEMRREWLCVKNLLLQNILIPRVHTVALKVWVTFGWRMLVRLEVVVVDPIC